MLPQHNQQTRTTNQTSSCSKNCTIHGYLHWFSTWNIHQIIKPAQRVHKHLFTIPKDSDAHQWPVTNTTYLQPPFSRWQQRCNYLYKTGFYWIQQPPQNQVTSSPASSPFGHFLPYIRNHHREPTTHARTDTAHVAAPPSHCLAMISSSSPPKNRRPSQAHSEGTDCNPLLGHKRKVPPPNHRPRPVGNPQQAGPIGASVYPSFTNWIDHVHLLSPWPHLIFYGHQLLRLYNNGYSLKKKKIKRKWKPKKVGFKAIATERKKRNKKNKEKEI